MLSARTQRAVTAPDELGPLAPVIERAVRIDVTERYPDAATMRAALTDVGESLPPPAPLPLAGMIDGADPHPTRTAAPEATGALFDQDAADVVPDPSPVAKVRRTFDNRRLVPWVVALVLAVTLITAGVALASIRGGTRVEVPGLVGFDVTVATEIAENAGLEVEVGEPENSPDPEGTIIAQSPSPGSFTDGDTVRITPSAGPAPVALPDVLNRPRAEAEAMLTDAGFRLLPAREEYHDTAAAGTVINVEPPVGTALAPESEVTLVVSAGRAPVEVASVRGMSFDQAKATLEGQGFTVQQGADEFSNDVAAGQAIGSTPGAGETIPYGATVTVVMSKGPDLVFLPNFINELLGGALAQLESAGFPWQVSGPQQLSNRVKSQNPPSGQVPRGSTVTLGT
jgi:serine/threonine-protein kinase